MEKHINFSKIKQFRNVVYDVRHKATFTGLDPKGKALYDETRVKPVITFRGTPKAHGTCSGVAFDSEGSTWVISSKKILTIAEDNAGFAFFVSTVKEHFEALNQYLRDTYTDELKDTTIVFFGEWMGKGVQKKAAVSQLPKRFMLFAVKIVPNEEEQASYYLKKDKWENLNCDAKEIYNVNDFESFSLKIDFNDPALAQNVLKMLTTEVENECPIGKKFGLKLGEDSTTGEGIVWVGWHKGDRYVFKVVGEKHSSSRVKVLAQVDTEKLQSVKEFVGYAATENRLEQALKEIFNKDPIDITKMGDFLRWLQNDIIAEEGDTLADNGLIPKDVNSAISTVGRVWLMEKLKF